jgi:DNA-3-methyladenine glycosylase I
MTAQTLERCAWSLGDPLLINYHDQEWGRPVHDDRTLFEFLVLEGAQAGLSWITILRKRQAYREAFAQFDPAAVARFDQRRVASLLSNPGIVRNRLKIESAIKNARAFLQVQGEFGSFARYQWQFVGGEPLVNRPTSMKAVPARTELSDAFSKDLKRRGFSFVGSTIVYAHMQAVGMVNDHIAGCFLCSPAGHEAPRQRENQKQTANETATSSSAKRTAKKSAAKKSAAKKSAAKKSAAKKSAAKKSAAKKSATQ